jgi:pimeloyl-ACP methyl ester carboxylesterase
MFDEHAFIARLEAADTEELAQMVARPAIDEEKALRTYLGDERYQRLHSLALRRAMMQSLRAGQRRASRGRTAVQSRNVIVIPGVLGSELTSFDKVGHAERIWLNPRRIVSGDLTRLQLAANGLNEFDSRYSVQATGIMKRYYGELMLVLGVNWNVHAFWYDWRKDMNITAAQLHARINTLFPSGETVHIVAHSVGGLVARTYLANYDAGWARVGRLIMLGTPNHGLYTAPLALTGQLDIIQWIDQLDPHHNAAEIQAIVSSFPGFYQLLPSPLREPEMDTLYLADKYAPGKMSQVHLDQARAHFTKLAPVVDVERMVYIGGYDQPTVVDLVAKKLNFANVDAPTGAPTVGFNGRPLTGAIKVGLDGDGSVPHKLGVLYNDAKEQVPALFVQADHGALNTHPKVLAAIDALLQLPIKLDTPTLRRELRQIAETTSLFLSVSANQRPPTTSRSQDQPSPRNQLKQEREDNDRKLNELRKAQTRGNELERPHITPEERSMEELLTRGFVVSQSAALTSALDLPRDPPAITINLVCGDITQVDSLPDSVDVIAIGHYRGTQPQGILRQLDEVLSCAQNGGQLERDEKGKPLVSELLLGQLTQRGTIRAELADIFLISDPNLLKGRTIAIAGKGVPGRFSDPELTVLVRELCWTLGRLGKRHLATVLMGAGRDTASVSDAVSAWVRGIKNAITGVDKPAQRMLQEITFIESDPMRARQIDIAFKRQRDYFREKNRLHLHYQEKTEQEREELSAAAETYFLDVVQPTLLERLRQPQLEEPTHMRVTVGLEGGAYVFGAVSNLASIPEREIPLDPQLVTQANDEIAAERSPDRQLQLGQFMERLLIPHDLRNLFTTPAPIVMTVDATTARIHWEMLAQSELTTSSQPTGDDRNQYFLGISRGFTRQLRTRFAPIPQPPPPAEHILRVLVVADPAADAHLPGAEEEGVAVADLFEHFNVAHAATTRNRVEVVRLFGPREATRTAVLRHLMMRSYNVLHFAGHCVYDKESPPASGWIFTNGERISANELRRIDRMPMFIFSNACESGITPERASERSIDLAPSFAEAFFAQGVANFVCTAWPVDDRAARDFALTLYAGLLGLDGDGDKPQQISIDLDSCQVSEPKAMFVAMRNARSAIADPRNDIRTWGAYQHYGDPYFRLFDPSGWQRHRNGDGKKAHTGSPAAREREARRAVVVETEQKISVQESTTA